MSQTVLFVAAILVPVIVLTVLRVDAAMAFLSLCLGYVLVHFVSTDAISLLTTVYPHASSFSESTIKIIFLWLPVVLTIVAMFHSVHGVRVILNILPALGVGALGVILLEPLLSPGLRGALAGSSLWSQFQQAQTLVVGLSSLVSLVFLWLRRRGGKAEHKHRSKG